QDGEPPAVSRIDEANLRAIAAQLGVPYVHRDGPGPTADLVAGIDFEALAADGRGDVESTRDLVWPWALGAGALLLWEVFSWARAGARPRLRLRRGTARAVAVSADAPIASPRLPSTVDRGGGP